MTWLKASASTGMRKRVRRLRKQVMWLVVIFIGTFIVYAQMTNISSMTMEGDQLQPQRFMYPLSQHQDAHEESKKHQAHFVDFINATEQTSTKSSQTKNKTSVEEPIRGRLVIDVSLQGGHKTSTKPLTETQRRTNSTLPPIGVSDGLDPDLVFDHREQHPAGHRDTNEISGSNAAVTWSGGSFGYNPYGEPVYKHDKRENYIPKERVVHFDLKGAPPLPSIYKSLIPWLAKSGATSILLEYEDMFPWSGPLASFAAKNHYTKENIEHILDICEKNNIRVIPLVQTFGHLEFALKLPNYSFLREDPEIPQALCPSQKKSRTLVNTMIDQIMSLHKGAEYLHIGCDEVFQIGECDQCRGKSRESLFLEHVAQTAKYALDTYGVQPIIWHDMLMHIRDSAMKEYNLGYLVEPMVWVYAEDIYRFVQPPMWTKFSRVFPTIWGASAFKGAFGEQSTVPNIRRHLDNNLNWLDVLSSEDAKFTKGIKGLVLTGWQRFDHFAVLCELFPSALPSLAVNLIATSHGFFNSTIYPKLYESLNCMHTPKYQTGLYLDSDPFLWDKFSWCYFYGALVFKTTARLDATRRDIRSYIDHVTLGRGWLSDYNRRHNFSSPMRIDEDLEELPSRLHEITQLVKTAKEALAEWFDEWTIGEWIEQHIWPLLNELQTLQKEAESMKLVKIWPQRPLPLLRELNSFGIKESMVPSPNKGQNQNISHHISTKSSTLLE